ncbi:NlpC/P60 family protein [Clostridium perfringens]|uniref:C40 family peptidase n=1 Tax=Clostridium perfringens TaxID=1502 RepID=UPI0013E2997D|nr:C40 family peptidase [Clostridium perfringens]NGU13158.1 NlpC/P60 family protein [Clostridium perfringens]
MAKRPTRLRFTEDDLADSHVKKAANRADKAADKAEKAVDKLASKKKTTKLRLEKDAAGSRKAKLRFEKADITEIERPSVAKHMASRGTAVIITSKAHQAVSEYEDDNVGVQSAQEMTKAVESTAYTVDHAVYGHKLKAHAKADKLVEKSDKANVDALYEKFKKDNPDAGSNPFSRWQQKKAIKKEYAAAKAGKNTASTTVSASKGAGKATGKAAQGAKNISEKVTEFCTTHSKAILLVLAGGLLFMIICSMFSSCTAMFQGGAQVVLGTSFTANDEDIIGADNDYKALEAALRNKINNIERTHSGYDEYRYDLDEINHNPYELAAYLTVQFEDYTRSEVQSTLQRLFDQQYELTLTEEVEIRTRTETRTGTTTWTDPETGEVYEEEYEYEVEVEYEYYILNVKLENIGLNRVIGSSGMSEDEMERYAVLLQTSGNRPDIFGGDIYAVTGEYTDYDIPGEALTDTRFANMIREAEKYLGYPYVWGGSSPSTSFDCSGFVSWVINNCGNGWSVGRLTANGLMGVCDIIPRSSAKPGDLIFFQGTYDTSGASHVGIYVGNGMMIHCGNPISYASIESNYWQSHFYCFGRIRN